MFRRGKGGGGFFAAVLPKGVDKRRERGYNGEEMAMKEAERKIYFDHAATTPLDEGVLEKMLPYFTARFGNADSLHSFGREAMRAVDEARDSLAALVGARPEEIYFTSGGTESDNWAVLGAARAQAKKGRPRVVISAVEHHAILSAGSGWNGRGYPSFGCP